MWIARKRRTLTAGIGLAWMLLVLPSRAYALNPALAISQYSHTAWTIREGFFTSPVSAIAQTPDGYLWLGTESGLLRFDGVRAMRWEPRPGEQLPSTNISELLVADDGRLWIGTYAGLASLKDGHLVTYPELAGQPINSLAEDSQRTVWAGTLTVPHALLCAIRSVVQCVGQDGRFGVGVFSLYGDHGALWIGAASGLWRWTLDGLTRYATTSRFVNDLLRVGDGPLLIATADGIDQLVGEKLEGSSIGGVDQRIVARRLLADHDRGLWIATSGGGLVHVHNTRADVFARADGLSDDRVRALFADREGNIWVGTDEGLDRFRELAVTAFPGPGTPPSVASSVLAARDGSVWVGTTAGLSRWKDGSETVYRTREGLPDDRVETVFEAGDGRILVSTLRGIARFNDGRFVPLRSVSTRVVYGMVEEHPGEFWISDQEQGLIHVIEDSVAKRIPWSALGHDDHATAVVADRRRGGLWLGFYSGGVAFVKDATIRASYGTADGLGAGRVSSLQLDDDGTLWAATTAGLSRITDTRITTLTTSSGLPCATVHWTIADAERALWMSMPCGLARIAATELAAWSADPNRIVASTLFDSSDGVRSPATPIGFHPPAARLPDGRIWFATATGIGVVDPNHLPLNTLAPAVHIEQLVADRKAYDTWPGDSRVALPALTRDLQIDYTALSLVAPDKMRFRYRLEGKDRDWQDVGTRRQAFYADLPPGRYRFHVTASNNSGVWNETGATLDFAIAPAYYQTGWFRAFIVIAFVSLVVAAHRLRLRQVASYYNARLDARVAERTRIARDLHDTLLQSFQGVLLKFHALSYMLGDRPEARQQLEAVIEQARQAITEGRDAVQGLRASTLPGNDLARAIITFGAELASAREDKGGAALNVQVEGASRDLASLVHDDVYRIACEAVRNAYKHAGARQIEVEIHYDERQLRLRIRDDGQGIDQAVLRQGGRAGHYGLPGMHERARAIGGKLTVWSEVNSGTEIELIVPAAVAYARPSAAGSSTLAGSGA